MRIQFVIGYDMEETVDINVKREPTDDEMELIENEIYDILNLYEEENGDRDLFDWYGCIYDTVEKHIPIDNNPVIRTSYLM